MSEQITREATTGFSLQADARRRPRSDATVRIRLTRGCAEHCLHCPDSARYGAPRSALPLADVAAGLAAAFARFDPARTQVIVTGGEPADHSQLLDVIGLVRGYPVAQLKLASNGVRLANDPAFAARVLEAGVDQLFLSVDLPGPQLLRKLDHASAATRLLTWLRARPGRPRVALNTMIFEAAVARTTAQLTALARLGADELRLLRFDPTELPREAPGLRAPSAETWHALRDWARRHNRSSAARIACVDRRHNLATRASRTFELAA